MVISNQEQILALDCKMSFDNNALFRRNQISELRDKSQENASEVYASDRGLNYVSLRWQYWKYYKWCWFSNGFNGHDKTCRWRTS